MNSVEWRELEQRADEIWQRLKAGEAPLLTLDGQPIGRLVRTDAQALGGHLRALRLQALHLLVQKIQADVAASGANNLTEAEIQAEIDAVRRERRSAAAGPAAGPATAPVQSTARFSTSKRPSPK